MPVDSLVEKDGVYTHIIRDYQFSLPEGYRLVVPDSKGLINSLSLSARRDGGFVAYNYTKATMLAFTANAPVLEGQFYSELRRVPKQKEHIDQYLTNKLNLLAEDQVFKVSDSKWLTLNGYQCLSTCVKGVGIESYLILGFRETPAVEGVGSQAFSYFTLMAPKGEFRTVESDFKIFLDSVEI